MATYTINQSMAALETDPLRNYRFQVRILSTPIFGSADTGNVKMGFMSASGIGITTEIIPYREGGDNTTTRKMPGQSDFAPLSLSNGVITGQGQFWTWMKYLFSVVQGNGQGVSGQDFRFNVQVDVLDSPVTKGSNIPIKASFKFYRAWPTSISWSDLDAGSNAVLVQQLVLAHEGFDYQLAGTGAGDSVGTWAW